MTTPEWEVGDEVQLKSGGPVMTVVEISEHGLVHCGWGRLPARQYHAFVSTTLVPALPRVVPVHKP